MNLWKRLTRLNISLVGVIIALSLISGSAYATLEANSLFLLAIDPDRNGAQASYALDLNFDILENDIANFGSLPEPDTGLGTWLGESENLGGVMWGVFGAGDRNLIPAVRIVSTVNPADAPGTVGQTDILDAINNSLDFISDFNSAPGVGDSVEAASPSQTGFPDELGSDWGGITSFSSMGHFGETLEMYIFEIAQSVPFEGLPASRQAGGPWALSALGQVSFGATVVPVPAAFWLFTPALLGLFGARRKR